MSLRNRLLSLVLLVIGLCFLNGGCGFELRTASTLFRKAPLATTVYLKNNGASPEFMRLLKKALLQANIKIVNTSEQSPTVLNLQQTLLDYSNLESYYSVESRIYMLIYRVIYQLHIKVSTNKLCRYPSNSLYVMRHIVIRGNEALGSTPQLAIVTREMKEEAIRRLVTRLLHFQNHCL